MQVTVLGSGSSVQFEGRGSASFLLETDGKKVLLDAGFYLLDRLEKAGVMADEIDAVYISHKHPDHFMGLLHLLFALKNKYYTPKESLTIFGFKGIKEWIESFQGILGHWIQPDIKLIYKDDIKGNMDKISWQIFDTIHSNESTGVIINNLGKKLVYTGDTEYFEGLCDISEKADLLLAECGSGNDVRVKGHMSANDIEKIATIADVKKILITHIYPETDKTASSWQIGNTELMRSYDLQRISS